MSEQKDVATAEAGSGGRSMTGRVVSDKMEKTVTIAVERLVRHPVVGKYVRRTTRVLAHDESNDCREGDLVAITECRPMSRRKSWRVTEVLRRAGSK